VLPEFDMPGHTQSWARGNPELQTRCDETHSGFHFTAPMDPTVNSTRVQRGSNPHSPGLGRLAR
jgi:hexosaminidase